MFFDTKSLPDTAILVSAEILLWVVYAWAWGYNFLEWIYITQGVQHDPIITSDYGDQLPLTTVFGKRHIDTMTEGQYNSIPFNAVGLSQIQKWDLTKLCLRGRADVEDLPPPVGEYEIAFHSYQKGLPYRPMLHITYYPA
ncbi:unnamed protein product [marine sediment metagenome]|uniref:Uncharacterized protein n=1 Tax=marine sediment metagenome TaxID=412755 RepID=X1QSE7_9ZZZZ